MKEKNILYKAYILHYEAYGWISIRGFNTKMEVENAICG